jgi:hypothetical protein
MSDQTNATPAPTPAPELINPNPVPGKYQAVTIIMLANGIINIILGLSLTWAAIATIIGILCIPITVLPLVLGIFEVVNAANILSNKPVKAERLRTLAIFEIINIIYGNLVSLTAGILNLVFLDSPEVKEYLEQ